MRYDVLDLRLFGAVVAEGSITAGAARLHLSLPSASARLRALEHHAGVDLLVRGRRGVRPTPVARYRGRAVDLGTVVDLVAAGVGLAVVPRHTVDPARGLAVCELAEPFARRTLVLRRGARPGPGVDDLAEHLRQAAASV
ncbi:hypothetical protein Acsp06_13880 [Actinomycetospora sp. NBRC 106375]|uniref:LysR family transcriptional regulator n=1 Tax=Actinomycetospora sp. NBRC 106375 TaxID=3032207 RepID=UPI0024A1790D|nr:LysR family transcriptional regulator [Actinomycetospora sp. NBRC 106375]GLZ45203.1 hypothetical protein Acsp06_13880 [Actinomycetospora sp. NBRC 106375]